MATLTRAPAPAIGRQTLTVREVATILGVHKLTVLEMVGRGKLASVDTGHRRVLIPKMALERLLGHPLPAGGTGEE